MKKRVVGFIFLGLLLISALLLFLSISDPGLRCLVLLCNRLSGGRLTISSASGSLLDSLQLQGIRYADSTDTIIIDTLTLAWDPAKLLNKQLQIKSVHSSGIRILLGPSTQELIVLPSFFSPVSLLIEKITAEKIAVLSNQKEMMLIRTGTLKHLSLQGQTLAFGPLLLATAETTLQATGQLQTTEGYPLQVTLESLHQPAGYAAFSGKGTLQGPLNALELNADLLTPFPAHLKGQLRNLLGRLSWEARMEGQEVPLRTIHQDWPDQRFANVVINGEGTLDEYTLNLHSSTEVQQLKKSVGLVAEIRGNAERLQISSLNLVHGKTTLALKAALDWSPAFSWQAEVTGSHLNPSILFPDWPGDFSCTLNTTGRFGDNGLNGSLHLPILQGTLRHFPFTGKGEMNLQGKHLQIPQFVVSSAGSTLRISGKAEETLNLSVQLDSSNLAELWPNTRGKIHAQGRLTGIPAQPEIELKLMGTQVGRGNDGMEKLTLETKGMLSREGHLDATVKAEQLQFGRTLLNQSRLHLQGSITDHVLIFEARNPRLSAGLLVQGKVIDKAWQGTLRQTHVTSLKYGDWQQQQPTLFSLTPDKAEMKPFCLASPPSGSICLNGSWLASSASWQLHTTVSSLPLNFLKEAWDNSWPIIEGQLNGSINLTGQQFHLLTAKLDGDSGGMILHIPFQGGTEQHVKWRRNTLHADYANNQLQTTLDSELTDNSAVRMDLRLVNLQLPRPNVTQTQLKGAVQLQMQDLSLLTMLSDQMARFAGVLQGHLTLNGTLASPVVAGQIELANGQAEIPPLGITLSPLSLSIKGNYSKVELQAMAHSGSGWLRAESTLNLAPADFNTHTLGLTGEAFKAAHLPSIDLDVSPDLQVTLRQKQVDVRGTIGIPKARITSIDFNNSISPSSDIVVIDDEQESVAPTPNVPLFTTLTLIAGDDVQIDAYGLKGAIIGQLQVNGQPARPLVGKGTLSVRNGSFALYGKRLKIDRGRLLFTGGPLTNPGVELRSETKRDKVTTGVVIEGFLQHPEMTFYSTPSMEQSAIISNLLKDTAIGGETRQDTGFVGKMATKTGLGEIVPYLQSVKKLSMIDEIKLETSNKYDSFSLIFGSWLTPSFYVSYGKNLLTESGNFNTRYTLGKGFYFMTETGASQSGGDLKYEFEH